MFDFCQKFNHPLGEPHAWDSVVSHILPKEEWMILRLCSSAGKGWQRYKKVSKRQKSEHIILIIDTIIQRFDTMASRKAAHISIDQARWIDKAQAMAWVGVKTEAKFDEEVEAIPQPLQQRRQRWRVWQAADRPSDGATIGNQRTRI